MSPKESILREEVSKIVQKVFEDTPHLNEGGFTGWVIDKVANGLKWAVNRNADYQYDGLLNSKEFRGLASRYGYNNESDFVKRAKELIKKDPKKFAKILAYDIKDSAVRKYKLF